MPAPIVPNPTIPTVRIPCVIVVTLDDRSTACARLEARRHPPGGRSHRQLSGLVSVHCGPMPEAVILSAVRTPVGRHGGALSGVRPDDLAALAISTRSEERRV